MRRSIATATPAQPNSTPAVVKVTDVVPSRETTGRLESLSPSNMPVADHSVAATRRPASALPRLRPASSTAGRRGAAPAGAAARAFRSEEHTSELQSQSNLVCRLLLEKKKKKKKKD